MEKFSDLKIDSQLKTAIEIPENILERSNIKTGYNPKTNLWEVIVKYNGNLNKIKQDLDILIEILSDNYAIVTLSKEKIFLLATYREIEYIEQPRNLYIMLDTAINSSCITQVKSEPYNLTGKGTIIGLVDSGISYLHKDFINEDGTTRILYIWDQTIDGNPPEGFINGTLYSADDINRALKSDNPFEIVSQIDDLGHGTAVAGICCGNGRTSRGKYKGVASESNIIAVKLGEKGRESFGRTTEIMRAIKFIIDTAIKLNMPVAINLSFGSNDGSHMGTSLFETYINDMSNIWKTSICVATGNEGASSHHYEKILKNEEIFEIEISLESNLKSLYIVLFKNFVDLINVKIISPTGEETGFINNSVRRNVYTFGNSKLYFNLGEPTPYSLEQGMFFEIITNQNQGNITSGVWRLVVYGENIVDGRINAWLPITEIASENTKFLNPSTKITLTIPSTAENVISVGSYDNLTGAISDFSGKGFSASGEVKPDLIAPGVNIMTTSNTLSYDSFSGTSVATPFVTGACAILMQWGIVEKNDLFLYGQRLKAFLRLGAKRNENIKYPNFESGYGKLCVLNTLNILNSYKNDIAINTISGDKKENLVYSDDYITMFAQYNKITKEIIEKYDFINFCRVLTGEFVILYIEKNKFNLITNEEASKIALQPPTVLGLMDISALESTGVLSVQNQPFLKLRGRGVLVAIIDTGINYTLPEFIYEDNTSKIVRIWDQTIQGKTPEGYCFGAEYTREDINLALSSDNPFNVVPTRDEIGHGTKLATVCAGRENIDLNFIGVAPDSELIVVKLKQANKALKEDEFIGIDEVAYSSADLMIAIEYVYQKSIEFNMPIAICIGLGTNSGFHNGLSILERYISNIAIKNGVCINVCNGNEGNAQHHSLVKLTNVGDEKIIELKVGENENGFPLNIISYPSDRISIEITSPTGETTGKIPPRDNYDEEIFLPLSDTRIRVRYYNKTFESSGQLTLLQFKKPSSGIWKILVRGEKVLIGDIHSFLPIKNFIKEDTYFLNPDPFYTVTIPATSNSVISVGGYNHINNSFFIQSGRGPTRLNNIRPIICAPAVNVPCIDENKMLVTITGTSVATAISTGCSALLLEWGIVKGNSPTMNSVSVIGYFISGAKRQGNELYPNNLWGFGRLNILETFENL